MLKNPTTYFVGEIYNFLRPCPPALPVDDSAGRITIKLWWTNQEFSPADNIPLCFSMLICNLGNEQ
jgi:hypothetical protein